MKSKLFISAIIALNLFALNNTVNAQAKERVYATDARDEVVRSGANLCWRTGYWTPAGAAKDPAGCSCDKDLLSKEQCNPTPPKPTCDFTYNQKNDLSFAFNQAVLRPDAIKKLNKEVVAKFVNCSRVTSITITGHTDRIGTNEANQKLSERRAQAVKAYLVKKGVPARVINIVGAGETDPVTGTTCDNKLPRKELIECLAPDRRTVIDVKGLAK